ncbi:hypothetical protein GQ457_02G027790 [Hibiscus cannabinus]
MSSQENLKHIFFTTVDILAEVDPRHSSVNCRHQNEVSCHQFSQRSLLSLLSICDVVQQRKLLRTHGENMTLVGVLRREKIRETSMKKFEIELERMKCLYTRSSVYHECFLDEQFTQFQELQDKNNLDFVVEVVSLFFEDSERLLNELTKAL